MKLLHMGGLCCLALMLGGCMGGSTNPREGGLFSYNPEAYEQRQQERQARLAAIEDEQRRESGRTATLEGERAAKTDTVARQQRQVQGVEKDLAAAKRSLNSIKAANAAQEQRLADLRSRAGQLDEATAKASAAPDTAARKAELERLKKEAARLKRDIDVLASE